MIGDECLGGLFVGEKSSMAGWVMEKKLGKYNYVRVRERGRAIGKSVESVKYFINISSEKHLLKFTLIGIVD